MTENISCNELYRIINRALSKWGEFDGAPADKEIKIFNEKYNYRRATNPQIGLFEDALPSQKEVERANQFCSDLEFYREATDIYSENNFDVPEKVYRRLYENLEHYAPHISAENQVKFQCLKQSMQRNLPERQSPVLLSEYNKEMDVIKDYHKRGYAESATRARVFLNQLMNDEDIKTMPPSPEKLSLFEKSLKVVDCLPKGSTSRSYKFSLKRDINMRIQETASNLGPAYIEKAQLAKYEISRFQKAIDKAQ